MTVSFECNRLDHDVLLAAALQSPLQDPRVGVDRHLGDGVGTAGPARPRPIIIILRTAVLELQN